LRPVTGAGEVAVDAANLRARGILQQRRVVRRARIPKELTRDHRNGTADVAELGIEPISREGRGGAVTFRLIRRYFEWREDNHFVSGGISGGRRRCRLGLQRYAGD